MKSMHAWTSSLADADYRGFTHLRANYRGITHPASNIVMASFTAKEALAAARPVDNCRFACFSASKCRGFTHPRLGGSHTGLSGFHTPNHGVSPTSPSLKAAEKQAFLSLFFGLTFLTIPI